MRLSLKTLLLSSVLAASVSQAAVFSNVCISSNADFIVPASYSTSDKEICFFLPGAFALWQDKTVELSFTVTAEDCNVFKSVTIDPWGGAFKGGLCVDTDFKNGLFCEDVQYGDGGWLDLFGKTTYCFDEKLNSWDVSTTLDLDKFSAVPIFKMSFCEEYRPCDPCDPAVPEPMTMGVLAMGVGGLIMRRRKK